MHILICDPDKAIMEGPNNMICMCMCAHIHACIYIHVCAGRLPWSAGRLPGSAGRLPGSAGRLLGSVGRLPGSAYNLTSRPWHTKGNNNREDKAPVHLRPRASVTASLCPQILIGSY